MMANAKKAFKQDDVKRAVAGALGAGFRIGAVRISPVDGSITILSESSAPKTQDDGGWDEELDHR